MKPFASKRFAWLALAACAGCCAVIPVFVFLGVTGVVGLSWYFELAAGGFFVLALALFGYVIYRSKSATCKLDCACKTESN